MVVGVGVGFSPPRVRDARSIHRSLRSCCPRVPVPQCSLASAAAGIVLVRETAGPPGNHDWPINARFVWNLVTVTRRLHGLPAVRACFSSVFLMHRCAHAATCTHVCTKNRSCGRCSTSWTRQSSRTRTSSSRTTGICRWASVMLVSVCRCCCLGCRCPACCLVFVLLRVFVSSLRFPHFRLE